MPKVLISMTVVALTTAVASGYSLTETQTFTYTGQPGYQRLLSVNQFDDRRGRGSPY